jgi:hypothetical protein
MIVKSIVTFFQREKIPVKWSEKVTCVAIWKGILIYGLLMLLIIMPFICRYNFVKNMQDFKVTFAKITTVKSGGIDSHSPSYFVNYSYSVENKTVNALEGVTKEELEKLRLKSGEVYQYIWIKYSITNPENALIIYDSFPSSNIYKSL